MKSRNAMVAFARESLGLARDAHAELLEISGRGSERSYFRFRWGGKHSAILVHYRPERIENTYFADIAVLLKKNNIPVPEIFRHDREGGFILMEDLGNTDLWSLRDKPWEERKILYRKTLAVAKRLHSCPEHFFELDGVKLMDAFGPRLYRWERNYFKHNFVGRFCRISLEPDFEMRLEAELSGMAGRLESYGRSLVHRDLQSQNIMICRNEPFLIDFQGMRFGTRFYDLGSLLCDPYVRFSRNERTELLSCYYEQCGRDWDWDLFNKMFWEASAQRLMQALGAYAFLGLHKGLKEYWTHIPAGLRNLRLAAENAGTLPWLLKICTRCDRGLRDSSSHVQNS
jgi:aminoglycoside/choline kinase family phosphotransferase